MFSRANCFASSLLPFPLISVRAQTIFLVKSQLRRKMTLSINSNPTILRFFSKLSEKILQMVQRVNIPSSPQKQKHSIFKRNHEFSPKINTFFLSFFTELTSTMTNPHQEKSVLVNLRFSMSWTLYIMVWWDHGKFYELAVSQISNSSDGVTNFLYQRIFDFFSKLSLFIYSFILLM